MAVQSLVRPETLMRVAPILVVSALASVQTSTVEFMLRIMSTSMSLGSGALGSSAGAAPPPAAPIMPMRPAIFISMVMEKRPEPSPLMVVVLSDLRQLEEVRANAPRAVVEMSLRIMGVVWVMGWRGAGTGSGVTEVTLRDTAGAGK